MEHDSRARLLLRGKKLGATALVAGGLVAGSFGVATAATGSSSASSTGSGSSGSSPSSTPLPWGGRGGPGGPGGFGGPGGPGGPGGAGGPGVGSVTAVSPTSLTVSRPSGSSVTYTLNSATTYRQGQVDATYSALAVGEHVAVQTAAPSSSSSSSTPAVATQVDIILPTISGAVQSVSTSGTTTAIVVADAQGFWRTIVTSSATTYSDDGTTVTSPTITSGEFISAEGTIDANHTTLDASHVSIGKPTPPAAPSGSAGSSSSTGSTAA